MQLNISRMEASPVIRKIVKYVSSVLSSRHLPPQPGDVERTYGDVTKATGELGYDPSTSIQAGPRNFTTWLRGNT
jgi:UDP-glucuronate 4-epimerase